MACEEGLEAGLYLRSLFLSMAWGRTVAEYEAAQHLDLHLITDCKSLYDHLHNEGTPKSPADKRLERYGHDAAVTPERPCRPPIHWVPTSEQLVDFLTKHMRCEKWLSTCAEGVLKLPLKGPETDF